MMKTTTHDAGRRRIGFSLGLAASLLLSAAPVRGAVLVQELFDAIAGPPPGSDASLDGKGDTATSVGLTGTWLTHGSTGIFTASNFNVGYDLPGLPALDTEAGGIWNNTGGYGVDIFATRPLVTPINFAAEKVIYFSFRANNSGDVAMGIGFASGSEPASEFVGSGLSWNNARSLVTGLIDASNAAYIGHGLLDTNGGPYGIAAHEPMNSVNGPALVVGRLTLRELEPDTIEIKRYDIGDLIPASPAAVAWSATDTYDTSMEATHLLVWINGVSGNLAGELDAIRVGETWEDVVGPPVADPFDAWIAGEPYLLTGADALPSADPDGDGIPNSLEYVLGGDPKSPDGLELLPSTIDDGLNLHLVYPRALIAAVPQLPYVEYSSDLSTWRRAKAGLNGVTENLVPEGAGEGVDLIEVLVPKQAEQDGRLFLRLNAGR